MSQFSRQSVQAEVGFGQCALPDLEFEVVGVEQSPGAFSDQADSHVAGLEPGGGDGMGGVVADALAVCAQHRREAFHRRQPRGLGQGAPVVQALGHLARGCRGLPELLELLLEGVDRKKTTKKPMGSSQKPKPMGSSLSS